MAAGCLWQVDAINLDQLNVDADDNERYMELDFSYPGSSIFICGDSVSQCQF